MMDSTSLFMGIIFLFSISVAIFSSFNAGYFAQISTATTDNRSDTVGGIKRLNARGMMVLNVVVSVLSSVICIAIIYNAISVTIKKNPSLNIFNRPIPMPALNPVPQISGASNFGSLSLGPGASNFDPTSRISGASNFGSVPQIARTLPLSVSSNPFAKPEGAANAFIISSPFSQYSQA